MKNMKNMKNMKKVKRWIRSMVKNRTGTDLKVVCCSVQAGVDVFTKVRQINDLAGSERRRKGVPICSGGVDTRCDGCVGAVHWSSRNLVAGNTVPPEVLLESWVLFPEPTSMLAASRRTSGYGAEKTTPPP